MFFKPQTPAFLGLETLLWNQPLCSRPMKADTRAYCPDSWQACRASGTRQNGGTVRSSDHWGRPHSAEANTTQEYGRSQSRVQAHSVGQAVNSGPCSCKEQKRQPGLQAIDQKGVASKAQCVVAWKTPDPSASSQESASKKNLKEPLTCANYLSQNLLANSSKPVSLNVHLPSNLQ